MSWMGNIQQEMVLKIHLSYQVVGLKYSYQNKNQ